MLSKLDKYTEHLRTCANCGRGTFLRSSPIDLYCSGCWSGLFENQKFSIAPDYPYEVSSLFVWNKSLIAEQDRTSKAIENLIYNLKGGGLPSAFHRLAEHFAFGLINNFVSAEGVLVIPPSARPPEKDHALAWANALGEVLGLEILSPFEFATEVEANEQSTQRRLLTALSPQKRLKVDERFKRQFKLKDGIRLKDVQVVFVDDLITSGATAAAAYKALKSPVDFKVWTIARRPKLAGI